MDWAGRPRPSAAVTSAPLRQPITPVLCFVDGDWPLIAPPDVFRGVRLESARSLRKRLAGEVLDAAAIAQLARILAAALPAK